VKNFTSLTGSLYSDNLLHMDENLYINPIRAIRVHNRITQTELANLLGVTEQTVRRAEQGTFNYLPPSFNLQTSSFEYPHEYLASRYEEWRINKRNYLRDQNLVPGMSDILWMTPHMEQPLYSLRTYMMDRAKIKGIIRSTISTNSMAGFAKLVAIDPASYTEAEASYSAPVEGHVLHLLRDLGFDRSEITHFRRVRD